MRRPGTAPGQKMGRTKRRRGRRPVRLVHPCAPRLDAHAEARASSGTVVGFGFDLAAGKNPTGTFASKRCTRQRPALELNFVWSRCNCLTHPGIHLDPSTKKTLMLTRNDSRIRVKYTGGIGENEVDDREKCGRRYRFIHKETTSNHQTQKSNRRKEERNTTKEENERKKSRLNGVICSVTTKVAQQMKRKVEEDVNFLLIKGARSVIHWMQKKRNWVKKDIKNLEIMMNNRII